VSVHIYAYPYLLLYKNETGNWNERNDKEGPSGQIISLRAPDDKQSMSLDLMSGASVEEIQASLGGGWGRVCLRGWTRMSDVEQGRMMKGEVENGRTRHTPPALVEGRVGPQ
jgi:hypothetical protein